MKARIRNTLLVSSLVVAGLSLGLRELVEQRRDRLERCITARARKLSQIQQLDPAIRRLRSQFAEIKADSGTLPPIDSISGPDEAQEAYIRARVIQRRLASQEDTLSQMQLRLNALGATPPECENLD